MIPVFKPAIDARTIKAAVDALELGWLGMGSYVKSFEAALARTLELGPDRTAVAVNTCTSALHLALLAAGVRPGDEVLTPSLNNIGDFQAIGLCGARPVFVDIREADMAIDPDLIAGLVGPKTKAVIALHYMGVPCALDAVYDAAHAHGLAVVEDCAHAIGTRWRGRPIGSRGDFACFSFDAIKTVTCIDGGGLVIPSDKAATIHAQRLLGMTQPNERLYANARAYDFDVLAQGFRYHLANLHAAIGLTQLEALPGFITNRRAYARAYNEAFRDLPGIVVPETDFQDVGLFHYVLRVKDGRRDEFRKYLLERGVDTGVHWRPGHWFTWLQGCRGADSLPVTDTVGQEMVTLPLWSDMDDRALTEVIEAVRGFFGCGGVSVQRGVRTAVEILRCMKRLPGDAIDISGFEGYRLRPVHVTSPRPSDVDVLTAWRNRHQRSFLTEFPATVERTRGWLQKTVAADDSRVLFMIDDVFAGRPVGYVGLAYIDFDTKTAEADSVVRGEEGPRGLMSAALLALLQWGRDRLGVRGFGVRVLADNPAVEFYKRLGFSETARTPLKLVPTEDGVAWCATDLASEGGRELVHMTIEGKIP